MSHVPGGGFARETLWDLQRRRVRVMLTGANERVAGKLRRAGIVELIGEQNFCANLEQALERL